MTQSHPSTAIVTVTTAQALSSAQVNQVKKLLSERAGQAKVVFATDPSILGGIQIKIGDQRFDASLEGQLRRLQLTQDRCLITTAVPLTSEQYDRLSEAITRRHGTIAIDEVVDPTVIGGIKVVIGSQEFDRTIAGRLAKLHTQTRTTV